MKKSKLILLILLFLIPIFCGLNILFADPLLVEGKYSSNGKESQQSNQQKQYSDKINQIRQYLYLKEYDKALGFIDETIEANHLDFRLYLFRAKSYNGLEDYEKAVSEASYAIGLAPFNVSAYNERAYAYYKLGQRNEARADIVKALNINDKSSRALNLKKLLDENPDKKTETKEVEKPLAKTTEYKKNFNTKRTKDIPTKDMFLLKAYITVFIIAIFLVLGLTVFKKFLRKHAASTVNIKDKYVFIRQIGEGGMGYVYEGYDKALKRKVAIKKVKPELLESRYIREKFLMEARMVALLRHPCIVEIYTVIENPEGLFLVFEYVEGQTLETRLDIDGYLNFQEAKWIFKSVCKALHYAHSEDIIHCDLKPANIMITDEKQVKVMDFGVAKKLDGSLTAKTVAGTPVYMAPEQNKGFIKKQSDIYSLGVCLYEALTGQVPWNVDGFDIDSRRIIPVTSLVPSVPKEVDELIEKSLNEDPAQRIQSAEEFWNFLEKIEI